VSEVTTWRVDPGSALCAPTVFMRGASPAPTKRTTTLAANTIRPTLRVAIKAQERRPDIATYSPVNMPTTVALTRSPTQPELAVKVSNNNPTNAIPTQLLGFSLKRWGGTESGCGLLTRLPWL
jgi:hypothetical protein